MRPEETAAETQSRFHLQRPSAQSCYLSGAYLDFAKLHLFLDGVHLLRPLHPPRTIVTTVDQLLNQQSQQSRHDSAIA